MLYFTIFVFLFSLPTFAKDADSSTIVPSDHLEYVNWRFAKCHHERASVNETCNEPEWQSDPINIHFVDGEASPSMTFGLDLTGIDSDPLLNYESPAMKFEVLSARIGGIAVDEAEYGEYFTLKIKDYMSEFEPLESKKNTVFCGLENLKDTQWSFDRASADEEISQLIVVLRIEGNVECSMFEIIISFLKKHWYLAVAGGVVLAACACVFCFCCRCQCNLCWCLDCFDSCCCLRVFCCCLDCGEMVKGIEFASDVV
jgi:hypothetical protein